MGLMSEHSMEHLMDWSDSTSAEKTVDLMAEKTEYQRVARFKK